MTTSTPPPSSPCKTSKKSGKKEKNGTLPLSVFEEDSKSSGSVERILRWAGFEDEPQIAKPLVLDDFGLIPGEKVDSTLLTMKRSISERRGETLSLEGSTDRLELFARSLGNDFQQPFRYAVAIVPGDTSEPVRVWDAQILTTERRVKRLKAVEESDAARLGPGAVESAAAAALDYKTAQNLLGEAFGTRKRKQAIVSMEKNNVRADSLGLPANEFIVQTLAKTAPAGNISENVGMASSLLPPFNKETLNVNEIYPVRGGLISDECFQALPVEPFIKLTVKSSNEDVDAIRSQFGMKDFWINRILSAPRDDGHYTLRLLLFAHFLSSFRELKEAALNGPEGSVAAVQSRIAGCPEAVAADLLARFADRIAPPPTATLNSAKHKFPNTLRDKAILYILTVLLHLDSFRVNATSTAELLAITPTKLVSFFKALGCTIDRPGRGEELNCNINNRLVPVKFARLTAPLTFPLPPKRQK